MTTISSIDARYAQSQITEASKGVAASVTNLTSGTRANANVADLSVGTVLATRVGTLRVTVDNAGQAKSLLETAKGALDTVLGLLQQQKNLSVKSADDSLSDNERGFLNQEFQALVSEIDRISSTANFNGKALLDGSISGVSTVDTTTGLAKENFGLISAGDTQLKGTVASGDLVTTESDFGVNKITVTANGTSGSTATFTVTNGLNTGDGDLSAAVTFTVGATIDATIDSLQTAFNEFSGTNATVVNNFRVQNNGDDTFSIIANEAGSQFNNFDFQLTTAAGITATFGVDAAGENVVSAARTFSSNADITGTDTATGVDGTFYTKAAYNVGDSRTSSELVIGGLTIADDDVITLTITDSAGAIATAGQTVTIALTDNGANVTEANIIDSLIEVINGGVTAVGDLSAGTGVIDALAIGGTASAADRAEILRSFVLEKTSSTTAKLSASEKGISMDHFDIQLSSTGTLTDATLGGQDADTGAVRFGGGTLLSTGSLRSVTVTNATNDENLLGSISNFAATYNDAATGERNSATFSVEINGKTYVSEKVFLQGGATGSNNEVQGNQIAANQEIIFYNPDGPVDDEGDLTDNAFVFRVGSSAITLSDMSTVAKAQESLNTIANDFETQLSGTSLNQFRSINLEQVNPSNGDHRITAAIGTVLEGLSGFDSVGTDADNHGQGDVRLLNSDYSSTGTLGDIGSFSVDRLTNQITTTVDGATFTAFLQTSDLPAEGGAVAFGTNLDGTSNVGSYDATSKVLDLQDATTSSAATSVTGTSKLHFFSNDTTDGRVLEIDLGNVSDNIAQIDISTAEGEAALENAFNGVFGVSSSESLNFQVGAEATDTIGVSIGSSKTTSLYKDDGGEVQTLSIATIEQAVVASDVIDNAINTVISLLSDVSAKISAFDSSIQNNNASIQNADAARSNLLDTDFSEESTIFAEQRVRVDAATAILTQVNVRIQNLLQLLQQ